MATNSTFEDMREARDIIRGLYNAAHLLACNDPDCPWARLFDEPSAPATPSVSQREGAVLLILFGIAENIGECLDLLRVLVADRDETSSLDLLALSSTTSHLSTEDTLVEPPECEADPPCPGLYRDQWTQTPELSPPVYTAFLHGHPGEPPRAPAPSPAVSESITPVFGPRINENHEEASCDGQGE